MPTARSILPRGPPAWAHFQVVTTKIVRPRTAKATYAFSFLAGSTRLIVPDNLKAGVTRAHRYEPILNASYAELAAHYGCAIIPARPYKPRDKAYATDCTSWAASSAEPWRAVPAPACRSTAAARFRLR